MLKILTLIIFAIFLFSIAAPAQDLKSERILHQNILRDIRNDIKENYYDPNFHGVDVEGNFKKTGELIGKASTSQEMTDLIARFCYLFDDSHLRFLPPVKTVTVDYGWDLVLIDDKVFITGISEDSDAYKKGLRIGDQIYMIEGYIPNRREFSMLKYHFEVLRPQPSLNIILIKPNGNKFKLDIKAKINKDSVFMPSRRDLNLEAQKEYAERTKLSFYDEIPGLMILKMPSFSLTPVKVDKMMERVEKSEALILDLRGNGGGMLASLEQLIDNFFEKEVNIGKVVERKGVKRMVVKPSGKKKYKGKLIVLIDSDSASAAELFARVVQLEKRGTVIGDRSAGAVMASIFIQHTFGLDSRIPYGLSVTVADIVMSDEQRLEKIGVTPDEKIFPTAMDLVNKRDPVISRAAEILGYKITPEAAGKIFSSKEEK